MNHRRCQEESPYFDWRWPATKLCHQESTRIASPQQSSILSSMIPELKHMVSQIEERNFCRGLGSDYGEGSRTPISKRKPTSTEERLNRLAQSVKRCEYEILFERSERRKLEQELQSGARSNRQSTRTSRVRENGKFTVRGGSDLATMPTMEDLQEHPVKETKEVGKLRKRDKLRTAVSNQPQFVSPPHPQKKITVKQPALTKQVPTVDIELKQLVTRFDLHKAKLESTQSGELRKRLRQQLIVLSRQIHELTRQKSQRYRNVQS